MTTGRFAPSPTGRLHVGNLRTALLAWLFARSEGGSFLVRMEDLDRVQSSRDHEAAQLADLASLGLDWDGPVVRQSDRFERYEAAIAKLETAGLTYPCYCTRREIRDAASAPHDGAVPDGAYPGTCRTLTSAQTALHQASGRPPALRLRAYVGRVTVEDELLGEISAVVDDVVLRRNDGVPAYNLAVVVDDVAQGVDQVVRGDDLLSSSPRQAWLTRRLGGSVAQYLHVPLVVNADGRRLAKRDRSVTLADLAADGVSPDRVLTGLARSLGLAGATESVTPAQLVNRFDARALPREQWAVPSDATGWS